MRLRNTICAMLLVFGAPLVCAQQPWTSTAAPTAHTLWSVAYGDSQFVAVGDAGTILTSADGQSWQAQSSGTAQALYGVTWAQSPKRWVAVGDAGTILTSPDAVTWTARASGTSQRLNAVAWNEKQFSSPDVYLAVGEGGAVVRSFDGSTWSLCQTGNTGSLRAVVAGPGWDGFIVAGHDGTLLTTTDDGDSFARKATGTSKLLTAITASGYRQYSATGADLVMAVSKDGGESWSLDRSFNPDGRENGIVYHGLARFNDALVIVGDAGRMVDEFDRPWMQSQPFTKPWYGVAASPSRVVAVGSDGTIASAPIDPAVHQEFTIAQTVLGDRVQLAPAPVRGWPGQVPAFQWTLDGTPIPGATQRELTVNSLAGDHNGTYSLTVSFSNFTGAPVGTATASAAVSTVPMPAALDEVDPTFHPHLDAAPQRVVPLEDGRLYIAGATTTLTVDGQTLNGFARLNVDGTLDPGFHLADGVVPSGTPLALIVQPDGRVVLFSHNTNTSSATYSLLRFNADGSVDASFTPDAAMVAAGYPPVLLADGRWLAVQHVPADAEYTVTLQRFLPNGAIDASYAPVALMNSNSTDAGPVAGSGAPTFLATRDAANRVYVGVRHGDVAFDTLRAATGHSRIFRLLPDGALDTTFAPVDVGPLQFLQATPHGVVTRTLDVTWARLAPTTYQSRISRLNFDGTADPRFQPIEADWTQDAATRLYDAVPDGFDIMAIAPDGAVIARSVGRLGHLGLVRFGPDGKLDSNFSAEVGQDANAVQIVAPTADGALLVAGAFSVLNGTRQPFLARIVPDRHAAETHLFNLSVRATVAPEAGPLIAGFVIANGSLNTLVRGAGPALAAFAVPDGLPDPRIALFGGPTVVAQNDNWDSEAGALLASTAAAVGAFPFADGSRDAALASVLPPRDYTLQVTSADGAGGIALGEVYAAGEPPVDASSPRLVNVSVRTDTAPGDGTLIAGFTLAGHNTRNVLIRAVGPGLAQFGVTNWIVDPVLTLYRGNAVVGTNDDWAFNETTKHVLVEAFAAVGAFPFDYARPYGSAASRDAAILVSLAPGNYSVQVAGKDGASGNAMIEVYELN